MELQCGQLCFSKTVSFESKEESFCFSERKRERPLFVWGKGAFLQLILIPHGHVPVTPKEPKAFSSFVGRAPWQTAPARKVR